MLETTLPVTSLFFEMLFLKWLRDALLLTLSLSLSSFIFASCTRKHEHCGINKHNHSCFFVTLQTLHSLFIVEVDKWEDWLTQPRLINFNWWPLDLISPNHIGVHHYFTSSFFFFSSLVLLPPMATCLCFLPPLMAVAKELNFWGRDLGGSWIKFLDWT